MSGSMAQAVLVGRLTRDAELKYTNAGQAVCHFTIATDSRRKKGDQWVEEPSFWDVDLWGKQGESVNQYLTKGKLVAVDGPMRQDKWEQDGQTRVKTLVTAGSVTLLGSQRQDGAAQGGASSSSGGQGAGASASSSAGAHGGAVGSGESFTDDIPF